MSTKTLETAARTIGGVFGLALDEPGPPPAFLDGDPLLLVNGRSAIYRLVEAFRPRMVYGCRPTCAAALLDGVRDADCEVRFYAIDERLRIADLGWIEAVVAGDLVFFIDYFGFPAPAEVVVQVKDRRGAGRARRLPGAAQRRKLPAL